MLQEQMRELSDILIKAGDIALATYQKGLDIKTKGPEYNIVTEADTLVEEFLIGHLRRLYPNDAIVAEESGGNPSRQFWTVDPIDSTAFYAAGLNDWSITIARFMDGEIDIGLVYCPPTREMFYAQRSKGAYLNGRRLQVSHNRSLEQAIVNLGQDAVRMYDKSDIDTIFKKNARAHAVIGSGALALARLSQGWYGVAVHMGQRIWDIAAGSLLIREAGGKVTQFNGSEIFSLTGSNDNNIVASNGILHPKALELLEIALSKNEK